MIDLIIYMALFLVVVGGLGVWIMKARSAMKSAGRNQIREEDFQPPSHIR